MSVHVTDDLPLHPSDAVAAIILSNDEKYVLQLRDDKPGIFFPAHWGLFGGGIDEGESEEQALRRELHEELGIAVFFLRHLMRFEFDLTSIRLGRFTRSFFEVSLTTETMNTIRLAEGQSLGLFSRAEVLEVFPVTPYDAFALWWYTNQPRIKQQ